MAFGPIETGGDRGVLFISKRSGQRANVRFMPGCLVWSLLVSLGLTLLVNLLIRAF